MKRVKNWLLFVSLCMVSLLNWQAAQADDLERYNIVVPEDNQYIPAEGAPSLDMVICLDISGSMAPYAAQAQLLVRQIVEESKKIQPTPRIRVGATRYGVADGRYQAVDLTYNTNQVLDLLGKGTGRGDFEPVGAIAQAAANMMSWSTDPDTIKVIYVVGNETAHQGSPDFRVTIPQIVQKNIQVNAVLCQPKSDEDIREGTIGAVEASWRQVAKLGHGYFFQFQYDAQKNLFRQVPSRKKDDDGLSANAKAWQEDAKWEDWFTAQSNPLFARLLDTVVIYPFSPGLRLAKSMDDMNTRLGGSSETGGLFMHRITSKPGQYIDLVEAMRRPDFNLTALEEESLVPAMQGMTLVQARDYLLGLGVQRDQLLKQIGQLRVLSLKNKQIATQSILENK